MNNEDIEYVAHTRYLGVILDEKLTWAKHINHVIKGCKKTLMTTKLLVNKKFGLTPAKLWWIWQAIGRPKIGYCCLAWADNSILKTHSLKLQKLQRLFMSITARCQKSTPAKGAEVITNTPPLHLWLREKALKDYMRIKPFLDIKWSGKTHFKHRRGVLSSLMKNFMKLFQNIPFLTSL
jgi:hypothetical protein